MVGLGFFMRLFGIIFGYLRCYCVFGLIEFIIMFGYFLLLKKMGVSMGICFVGKVLMKDMKYYLFFGVLMSFFWCGGLVFLIGECILLIVFWSL